MNLPDDPEIGCGYGWLKTHKDDPFFTACAYHDYFYKHKPENLSRAEADRFLLARCLDAAQDKLSLKIRAYIYYGIVRLLGGLFW